jgi:hypothetical protein
MSKITTDAEWLANGEPAGMLLYLQGKVSARKLQLIIAAMKGADESRADEVLEVLTDPFATRFEVIEAMMDWRWHGDQTHIIRDCECVVG